MKAYGKWRFLTVALDGCEASVSCPRRFPLGDRISGTYWTGGWVGLRASLDAMEKRKMFCPSQEMNPSCPDHSLVDMLTELSQLLFGPTLSPYYYIVININIHNIQYIIY
jgi:hypothetical protein